MMKQGKDFSLQKPSSNFLVRRILYRQGLDPIFHHAAHKGISSPHKATVGNLWPARLFSPKRISAVMCRADEDGCKETSVSCKLHYQLFLGKQGLLLCANNLISATVSANPAWTDCTTEFLNRNFVMQLNPA